MKLPIGSDECWPRYTQHRTVVAFVHVPVLVSPDCSTRYPARAEHELEPPLTMFVHPDGRLGGVVLPSRNANTMARSPGCHPDGSGAELVPLLAPTNESGTCYGWFTMNR